MPIDPSIPLRVQPAQVRSPLEAFQRAVSIRDMLGGLQERRQVEKINALKLKEAEFDLAAKERAAQDQTDYQNVLREGWKLDAQGIPAYDDSGLPQFDDAAISQKFIKLGRPNLLTKFKQEQATLRQSAAEALAEQAKADQAIHQRYGDTLASFEAIPEDLRPDLWQSWLAAKTTAGLIDKDYAETLAQQPYSPELLEGEIQANIGQKESAERHLKAAQIRDIKAKAAKAEQELTAPTEKGYAPGTLIITKDADGKEISRETVPEKESDTARKSRLVEEAYAQLKLKGKSRDAMTAAERVAAARWNESLTPEKKSDQDKLMELFRSKEDRKSTRLN